MGWVNFFFNTKLFIKDVIILSYSLTEAFKELNEKKNNNKVNNNSNENTLFDIRIYCKDDLWAREVYKIFGFKKDKEAQNEYLKVIELVQKETINTLHNMEKVKPLHSTYKNAYEIKWNINKIQYRIYCFKDGNILYLMVPFIKSNGDKDTDAAGIIARQRYLAM